MQMIKLAISVSIWYLFPFWFLLHYVGNLLSYFSARICWKSIPVKTLNNILGKNILFFFFSPWGSLYHMFEIRLWFFERGSFNYSASTQIHKDRTSAWNKGPIHNYAVRIVCNPLNSKILLLILRHYDLFHQFSLYYSVLFMTNLYSLVSDFKSSYVK